MSDHLRRLTAEQRDRVYAARKSGGLCAACDRTLSGDEPVYIERFWVSTKLFRDPSAAGSRVFAEGPVGVECVSPEFLEETKTAEPERCDGCGRGVYYRTRRPRRRWVACSQVCRSRSNTAGERAWRERGAR
jgi:hypothetical protein